MGRLTCPTELIYEYSSCVALISAMFKLLRTVYTKSNTMHICNFDAVTSNNRCYDYKRVTLPSTRRQAWQRRMVPPPPDMSLRARRVRYRPAMVILTISSLLLIEATVPHHFEFPSAKSMCCVPHLNVWTASRFVTAHST